MQYINNLSLKKTRIVLEMLIKTIISSFFLLIGLSEHEVSSLILGVLFTSPCVYSLFKFFGVSKAVSYSNKCVLIDEKKVLAYDTICQIKKIEMNFILKYMWSYAVGRFKLVPPGELIQITCNEKGEGKKYSFFVNYDEPQIFMSFISHVNARHPDIKVEV